MRAEYICPVLTAFDENGKVDMEAMKRQFDHLIEGGLNGIAIMGSSGEFYAMTLEEAMAFARDSIAYLKGKIPVYQDPTARQKDGQDHRPKYRKDGQGDRKRHGQDHPEKR